MKKLSILLYIAISLTSCSFFTFYPQTDSQTYPKTDPLTIKIYSEDIDQDYLVIGSVAADVIGDGEKAARHLKKEASKLGADAIIHVKLTKINSTAARVGISGVAIKFK